MKQCALMPKMMVNFEAATLWFQLLQKIYPGLSTRQQMHTVH